MPKPSPRRPENRFVQEEREQSRRQALLSALRYWNRNSAVRIGLVILLAWAIGALGLYSAEHRTNPAFNTLGESFWNVWVLLFSGMEVQPETTLGRMFAMVVVLSGVGLVGLFTGTVASVLVEYQLRRREVSYFEMEGHLVLCNWASRGVQWISEVHSKIIPDKRPVVIIHDSPDEIELPDTQDEPAFTDVYIVKGDPTNEVVLRRARVHKAHSVVVLADDRHAPHADGKTILNCIAIRDVCGAGKGPNVAVECRNPSFQHHLLKAGADEILSSGEMGLRILARTALYHGMVQLYQELLTVGRDANELYLVSIPEELVGRDFVEAASMFLRYRNDRRSCLLLGVQREGELHLNPIDSESGTLKADDQLILLSRTFLNPEQALPTVPPLTASAEPESAGQLVPRSEGGGPAARPTARWRRISRAA